MQHVLQGFLLHRLRLRGGSRGNTSAHTSSDASAEVQEQWRQEEQEEQQMVQGQLHDWHNLSQALLEVLHQRMRMRWLLC